MRLKLLCVEEPTRALTWQGARVRLADPELIELVDVDAWFEAECSYRDGALVVEDIIEATSPPAWVDPTLTGAEGLKGLEAAFPEGYQPTVYDRTAVERFDLRPECYAGRHLRLTFLAKVHRNGRRLHGRPTLAAVDGVLCDLDLADVLHAEGVHVLAAQPRLRFEPTEGVLLIEVPFELDQDVTEALASRLCAATLAYMDAGWLENPVFDIGDLDLSCGRLPREVRPTR